jgi:hypothetical protein
MRGPRLDGRRAIGSESGVRSQTEQIRVAPHARKASHAAAGREHQVRMDLGRFADRPQVVGPRHADASLLRAGRAYEMGISR